MSFAVTRAVYQRLRELATERGLVDPNNAARTILFEACGETPPKPTKRGPKFTAAQVAVLRFYAQADEPKSVPQAVRSVRYSQPTIQVAVRNFTEDGLLERKDARPGFRGPPCGFYVITEKGKAQLTEFQGEARAAHEAIVMRTEAQEHQLMGSAPQDDDRPHVEKALKLIALSMAGLVAWKEKSATLLANAEQEVATGSNTWASFRSALDARVTALGGAEAIVKKAKDDAAELERAEGQRKAMEHAAEMGATGQLPLITGDETAEPVPE